MTLAPSQLDPADDLYFYSAQQHRQFTNREHELAILGHAVEELRQGRPYHVACFGLRKMGKTSLLKEFAYRLLIENQAAGEIVVPVYVDFEEICSSPEQFALRYVGHVAYWYQNRGRQSTSPFLSLHTLLLHGPALMKDRLEALGNELAKAKPDRSLLLHRAFDFAEELAQRAGLRFLLLLDEFQTLPTLANFPDAKDVVAVFRAHLERHRSCSYVVAGSAITAMEKLLASDSPLFALFERVPLGSFEQRATRALAAKLLPADTPNIPELGFEFQRLTGGRPFYITALCSRLRRWQALQGLPVTTTAVKEAFVMETLSPEGRIYDFCRYVYDVSIQQARGHGALIAILQLLAEEQGLTIAEVARRQKVSSGTAQGYLRWLQEVDLVVEQDGGHYYADPVLRFWVARSVLGLEIAGAPRPALLAELVAHLDEQYQQAATDLGVAKESQVRELLTGFAGQVVDGKLLGLAGKVRLPPFERVASYRSADGQVEVDALAEGEQRWAVEVRWRARLALPRDLRRLQAVAADLDARPWFIAKAGFTTAAQDLARQAGVMCSDQHDVEQLIRIVGRAGDERRKRGVGA